MASALPTTVELELMKSTLACPICNEIPRDGVMLQCRNGHNVCATCKSHIAEINDKCPSGRCDYLSPPTRNWTITDLVERLPFEFPCKFAEAKDANHSSCEFKGTNDVLLRHEIMCEHRSVPCPKAECEEFVSASGVVKHVTTVHNAIAKMNWVNFGVICEVYWLKKDGNSSSMIVSNENPHEVSVGWVIPSGHLKGDQIYIFLQMIAPSSVTEKLKCQITLSKAGNSMNIVAPVYPIDWTKERIMRDDDCVRLGAWSIRKLFNEDIPEFAKKMGYCSSFTVMFKMIESTA